MNAEANYTIVDGFRFIENLQTTARQLIVCTEIAKQLNNKQFPKRILEEILIKWSLKEEESNSFYNDSKGKITNDGKKTAALRYYFSLSESLGLTKGFNNVFINTNTSYILLHFLSNQKKDYSTPISFIEKIFYLFQLLTIDADGILLCIDELKDSQYKNQSQLQKDFKNALNERLLIKSDLASLHHKSTILNKFRAVNYVWKKPEVYAEHIIAPRYEWLYTLGLVNISRESNYTLYSISEKGVDFYNYLPKVGLEHSLIDISDKWIFENVFSLFDLLYLNQNGKKFSLLIRTEQINCLGESMEKAIKYVKSSLSYRLPLYNTYLFVSMDLLINQQVVINFKDIYDSLQRTFIFNDKTYIPKMSGRANESYITITLNK